MDTEPDTFLSTIYRERREVVLRVLTRRLGDRNEAEEVLQEAFIELRKHAEEDLRNPAAYLMQIAINLSTDRIRQDASRRRREGEWMDVTATRLPGADYIADLPSTEAVVMARQELDELREHLEALSLPVRTAFIHHKMHGLTHAETAAEMGLSKSTVEKHIMKAMKFLLANMARGRQ